jgi:hypothetical protein
MPKSVLSEIAAEILLSVENDAAQRIVETCRLKPSKNCHLSGHIPLEGKFFRWNVQGHRSDFAAKCLYERGLNVFPLRGIKKGKQINGVGRLT